uniref:Cation efflux protein transmembrane domain-containing protein n=1 Tax=Grammatophora oceanica TaxID=210454 RepID=A0A7S1UYQ0_9STRA|mmetsp:Transcript_30044/g.44362  ORF Transcript_30044/g.44362 Transcript_30044/m.44362 type:complete len:260 (+) Transcript_30044:46-825(+)|eukprot:CAMPEP_0194033072 /NCGR_PEP_ID=MMETSP0009_2-20130614/5877_1 /TAXON_ID=210454 /ORGANISM="Grammatophora oceanica, Strain CCMP 410" /LENGTH=259 /DNA_ID=CAMNT_0038673683 /DNA_START=43 /DNA_END=822 /DNA_ORIENTATION=-
MATFWSSPTSRHAYILSWVSLVITIIAAGGGIGIYAVNGSALMLCYGLENCVDFLSSAVVLWRFYCPELNPEIEKKLAGREKRASISISIILGLLGIGIMIAAIDDFTQGMEEEKQLRLILGVSVVSILIFGCLAVFKFHYSILMNSASLHKDGICSLIGTILSAALFINTLIIKHIPDAWWVDPAVAMGCGIASICIGIHSIVVAYFVQGIPIFSVNWWFYSQGDGTDEISGRELGDADINTNPYPPTEEPPKISPVV